MKRFFLVWITLLLLCGCSVTQPSANESSLLTTSAPTPSMPDHSPAMTVGLATETPAATPAAPTEPEKTITSFFESYSRKDGAGMKAELVETHREIDFELESVVSVELVECTDVSDNDDEYITIEAHDYPDAYDHAVVKVVFSMQYADDYWDPSGTGTFTWWYKLVQPTQESDWLIFGWGV